MWLSVFALTAMISLCLCVAAVVMEAEGWNMRVRHERITIRCPNTGKEISTGG